MIIGVLFSAIVILGSFFIKKYSKDIPNFSINPISKSKNKEKKISSRIKQFGIKIDKINLIVPVVKNVNGTDKNIYNKELKKGVAHLKGSALPGGGSNIFIFGHSSAFIGSGPYSEIFSKLNNLKWQDKITVFYRNKKFNYSVFEKEIVEKNDISVIKPTKEEELTLMTCWPIGTNKKRLIIKAKLLD